MWVALLLRISITLRFLSFAGFQFLFFFSSSCLNKYVETRTTRRFTNYGWTQKYQHFSRESFVFRCFWFLFRLNAKSITPTTMHQWETSAREDNINLFRFVSFSRFPGCLCMCVFISMNGLDCVCCLYHWNGCCHRHHAKTSIKPEFERERSESSFWCCTCFSNSLSQWLSLSFSIIKITRFVSLWLLFAFCHVVAAFGARKLLNC